MTAYRSGEVSTIQAQTVYENDEFEYELAWSRSCIMFPRRGNGESPSISTLFSARKMAAMALRS